MISSEAKQKILEVDDNKEIVFSITKLLEYEGYEIYQAFDGIEALELLNNQPVDLILLDIMIPKMNGISALMKIRHSLKIPVIILSAKSEESDKVSGLSIGADDYVTKPYNTSELVARVKAQL
ncbi:response regulator transcription factor [Clostridium sp. Marseille-P299]|uniref:response regulator transcription factor n=1 Tax=Clostridium sp. Marseille-P299 TaxID=1805477 RepID=UPI000AC44B7C